MERDEIREGMIVRTAEGRPLGHVSAVGESHFELQPRGLGPDVYDVQLEQVAFVRGHDVVLAFRREALSLIEDDDGSAVAPHGSEDLAAEPPL